MTVGCWGGVVGCLFECCLLFVLLFGFRACRSTSRGREDEGIMLGIAF